MENNPSHQKSHRQFQQIKDEKYIIAMSKKDSVGIMGLQDI